MDEVSQYAGNETDDGHDGRSRHKIGHISPDNTPPFSFHQCGALRSFAKSLKKAARDLGFDLAHGTSLDATARIFGHRTWGQLLKLIDSSEDIETAVPDKLGDDDVDALFLPRLADVMRISPEDAGSLFLAVRWRLLYAIYSCLADPEQMIVRAKETHAASHGKPLHADGASVSARGEHLSVQGQTAPEHQDPVVVIKKARSLKLAAGKRVFNLG